MAFVEHTAQPLTQKSDLLKCINDICYVKIDGQYSGYTPIFTLSNFSGHLLYIYLNVEASKISC